MAIINLDRIAPTLTDFSVWRFGLSGQTRPTTEPTPGDELPLQIFAPAGLLDISVLIPSLTLSQAFLAVSGAFSIGAGGSGLTVNASGQLTGGTLRLVGTAVNGRLDEGLYDIRADARDILAAARTDTRADDDRFLRSLLGGDDIILLADDNTTRDVVVAGAGDDLVLTWGGADSVDGGVGRDFLAGGNGDDTLSGGAGRDVLFGDYGADRLFGGAESDMVFGDYGADVMFGGIGADLFVIAADNARDRVADFQDGTDRLVFALGPQRFADLRLTALDADSTVISWAGGSLRVDGVARAQLTAEDMMFGARADRAIAAQIDAALDANDYILT